MLGQTAPMEHKVQSDRGPRKASQKASRRCDPPGPWKAIHSRLGPFGGNPMRAGGISMRASLAGSINGPLLTQQNHEHNISANMLAFERFALKTMILHQLQRIEECPSHLRHGELVLHLCEIAISAFVWVAGLWNGYGSNELVSLHLASCSSFLRRCKYRSVVFFLGESCQIRSPSSGGY